MSKGNHRGARHQDGVPRGRQDCQAVRGGLSQERRHRGAFNHALAEESGLNVPALLEVKNTGEGWALVIEAVEGKTMAQLMAEQPEESRSADDAVRRDSERHPSPHLQADGAAQGQAERADFVPARRAGREHPPMSCTSALKT